jgi:hypothetical protein
VVLERSREGDLGDGVAVENLWLEASSRPAVAGAP